MKILKSFLVVLSLVVLPVLHSNAHGNESDKIKVNSSIVWGRHSLGCIRFGICHFEICISSDPSARVSLSDDGKTLVTEVFASAIKGHEELFSGSYFLIEESITLEPELQKALGSEKHLTIFPGKYRLEKSREGFVIYFVV